MLSSRSVQCFMIQLESARLSSFIQTHAGPTVFHSTAIGLSQKLRSLMERRHPYLAKPVKDIGEQIHLHPFFFSSAFKVWESKINIHELIFNHYFFMSVQPIIESSFLGKFLGMRTCGVL